MRILIALTGFLCAMFAPAWATVLCIVALSIMCRSWEALALGLFMDLLWLPSGYPLPIFTSIALVIVWGFEPLRLQLLRQ